MVDEFPLEVRILVRMDPTNGGFDVMEVTLPEKYRCDGMIFGFGVDVVQFHYNTYKKVEDNAWTGCSDDGFTRSLVYKKQILF